MEEQPSLINKKAIAILLLFIFIMFSVWFLLSYSWLTITSTSKEAKLINVSTIDGDTVKEFEQTDQPKTLLLKRGTYDVEASKGDEFSTYRKSLGFLWFNKLNVELNLQKASRFLGRSPHPCAKEKDNEVLFSSCSPRAKGNVIVSSKRGLLSILETGSSGPGDENPASGILKSYGKGYLVASANGDSLTISARETHGNKQVVTPGFGQDVASESFAVSPNSNNFAVFDADSEEILSFNNLSDSKPARISIPEDELDPSFNTRLVMTKDYIYLFNLEGEHIEGEPPERSTTPKIFTYSVKSNELINEYDLPDNWEITREVPGPNNQLFLLVNDSIEGKNGLVYLIDSDNNPVGLDTLATQPQDACWKDKDSFYYLADSGESIYLYSVSKQASFLVYGGLAKGSFVSGLQCNSGSLYFYFDFTRAGGIHGPSPEEAGYHHYKLTGSDFTGIRPESVLPDFAAVEGDVAGASLTPNGVKLYVEYDNDGNPSTPSKEAIKKAVSESLKNKGVVVSGLNFYFAE